MQLIMKLRLHNENVSSGAVAAANVAAFTVPKVASRVATVVATVVDALITAAVAREPVAV